MRRTVVQTAACGLIVGLLISCAGEQGPIEKEGTAMFSQIQQSSGLSLQPVRLEPLPLGSIHPRGWLQGQLRIQADGLSGHLDEFWPDIKDSAWFGGDADAWERAPYWLDGVVPLAFLLEDGDLTARVNSYMDTILKAQDESGRITPGEQEGGRYDLWAVFLVLKPLIQYFGATGDERVPEAVRRCLRWVEGHIDARPLFNWGKFRWFESLIAIYWLYERSGEPWLLDLAVKLQAQGFDWSEFFRRWPLTQPTEKGKWTYMGHVVNNAMAVKAPALWWRLSGEDRDLAMVKEMMALQDRFHGQVTGMFTGDECFAGLDPSQGTELCAVMEYMYSLELLLSITGDPAFGDRLEKITFNALPATFSPDMWSHQYDQQVNQVECSIRENRPWTTNGPDSNIFGLEPNYGCCTANLSQGWPKFAAHLWMKTKDPGMAAVAYAPCLVRTEIEGIPVRVEVRTEYPFRDTIEIRVQADRSVEFPLHLRIPGWTDSATVQLNGGTVQPAPAGSFFRVERDWRDETVLTLKLPMRALVSRRFRNAVTLERGPLIYSLKIGEEWRRVNADEPHRELPHGDWEVYPTTPWNYALDIGEDTLGQDVEFVEHPLGQVVFAPEGAPVSAKVKGVLLEGWRLVNGSAGDMPLSPVLDIDGPRVELILIPYGCTNLRVTEFPTLR
jgi:hypothetical protein